MLASVIGLRANATAIDVPSSSVSVCSAREQQREERVVTGLRRPRAAVAGGLQLLGLCACLVQVGADASVDLHAVPPVLACRANVVRRSRVSDEVGCVPRGRDASSSVVRQGCSPPALAGMPRVAQGPSVHDHARRRTSGPLRTSSAERDGGTEHDHRRRLAEGRRARRDPLPGEPVLRSLLRHPHVACAGFAEPVAGELRPPYLVRHQPRRPRRAAPTPTTAGRASTRRGTAGRTTGSPARMGTGGARVLHPTRHPVLLVAGRRVHAVRPVLLLGARTDHAEPPVLDERHDRPGGQPAVVRSSRTSPGRSRGPPIPSGCSRPASRGGCTTRSTTTTTTR